MAGHFILTPFNGHQDWNDDINQRCQAAYIGINPGFEHIVLQVLYDDIRNTPIVSRGNNYWYVTRVGQNDGPTITLRECFSALGYGAQLFFQLTMPLELNAENVLDTFVIDLPICQFVIYHNADQMMPPGHPVLAHQNAEILEPIPDWEQPDPLPA
jgi:hypothetical protein